MLTCATNLCNSGTLHDDDAAAVLVSGVFLLAFLVYK
jgi:hypothetical protein